MRYQWILLTGGLALALVAAQSCDGESSFTSKLCRNWCEAVVEGVEDCAEDDGCWIEDSNEFQDKCVEECVEGLDDLDPDERNEAIDCLECVVDEAGEAPDCADWEDAEQECATECNNDGAEEFYDRHNADLTVSCE